MRTLAGVAATMLVFPMPLEALSHSQNIALVPDARGQVNNGCELPTTGFPNGYAPTFIDVDPDLIGTSELLTAFDTVVLVGICDIGNYLTNSQ